MKNLALSVSCVAPVFFMLCVGALIRRGKLVPEAVFTGLSTVCFHALLPFLMFSNVYSSRLDAAFDRRLALFLLVGTGIWFALGCGYYWLTEPDPRLRGAYIQNAYRSNIAVVGISLAQIMLDQAGTALMTMAVTLLVPFYNMLAVVTLETCRGGRIRLGKALLRVLQNPMILGSLLGFAFLILRIPLPAALEGAAGSIGRAGSVMTLIALGASFRLDGAGKNLRKLAGCTVVRLVLTPLAAMAAAVLLGFRGNALGVILICTATPMATTAYPMAVACESDHELTGQIVVVTSMLCCATMCGWIFGLKQLGYL